MGTHCPTCIIVWEASKTARLPMVGNLPRQFSGLGLSKSSSERRAKAAKVASSSLRKRSKYWSLVRKPLVSWLVAIDLECCSSKPGGRVGAAPGAIVFRMEELELIK